MTAGRALHRAAACLLAIAATDLMHPAPAAAFPETDALNPSVLPTGGELAEPDVRDLRHQIGLLSGLGSAGSGWTFLPRVTVQETLTDNVLQAESPRRWDITTMVAPGIAIVGDTDRVKLRFNYEPTLQIYARTGSESAITQQLNAVGTVTLLRDRLFVDVRGLTGVQSTRGGVGGTGGIGNPGLGPVTPSLLQPSAQLGTSKQDKTQTSSFILSPYVLYNFGDWGTGKVGVSASETSFSRVSGFAPMPFGTGANGQSTSTLEETVSFQTGDVLSRIRDRFSADAQQSIVSGGSTGTSIGSASTLTGSGSSSTRSTMSNRIDYAFDQSIAFYTQLGWENIHYSGNNLLSINGPTWEFGVVYTPDQDTRVTLGYGRENGRTSWKFDGRYALTPRTVLTASYTTGIGTQQEQLRNQLNRAVVDNNGGLVNGQTGGPLFTSTNALGVSPGVYQFDTLSVSATTVLDRDTVTLTLSYTSNTHAGAGQTGGALIDKTANLTWLHQMTPDLGITASAYYSAGSAIAGAPSNSLALIVSGQYTISETVAGFARYAFYQRQSNVPGFSMYQDMLILGITKQF